MEEQRDPRLEIMDYIRSNIGAPSVLEQFAEECVELAHCAQKQARLLRGENPTTADMVTLVKDMDEELADVFVCIDVLGLSPNRALMDAKLQRWNKRIADKNNPQLPVLMEENND